MKTSKELDVLHALSKAIVGVKSATDVCKHILNHTVRALKVNKASIMKLDEHDGFLKIIAALGLPKEVVATARVKIGEGISGKVFKSARPVLIKDVRASGFTPRKRYTTRSLMSAPVTCFPMKINGRPIGVINVTDRKGGAPFTQEDLRLLTTIANQTAAYLHLCDLAEEARKTEGLKQEIELAREIQQRLFPRFVPKFPGFDVAGKCLTAERVGGDYFDYLVSCAIPPSIVVADVAGHSIGAAMMMGAFRSAVRSGGVTSILSPSIVAERLNTILYEDLSAAEQFISMVYLQVIPDVRGRCAVKYTTAGHYPPLVMQKDGFVNHSTQDMLLGVDPFAGYHEKKIEVSKGDIIILYTDGLIEAANKDGRRFGIERVKGFLKEHKHQQAASIVNGLCDEVKRFVGNICLVDDVTLVVMRAV